MRDRVRLELEPDRIGVRPDQRSSGQADTAPADSRILPMTTITELRDVTAMSEGERVRLRREIVTDIFQSLGLLPVLSVLSAAPTSAWRRSSAMLSLWGTKPRAAVRRGRPA